MGPERPSRRRAIAILATAAAGSLLGAARSHAAALHEWRGIAMGSDARILFSGTDLATARAAAHAVVAEIERLENALSLFRETSEIRRLNRDKALKQPSRDFHAALSLAVAVAETSGGLFDPTVQALWEAHVDWFAAQPQAGLPPEQAIAAARRAVDWRGIALSASEIRLGADQRITLNGLGQGYVTDRVAALLRARGYAHVLIDLGEQHALGAQADGRGWAVARAGAEPIVLHEGALATSEGSGCILGARGEVHHLFDPRSGRSAPHWQRITVRHPSAAVADALSTALYAATPDDIETMVARFGEVTVWATDRNGSERLWKTPA